MIGVLLQDSMEIVVYVGGRKQTGYVQFFSLQTGDYNAYMCHQVIRM
jgi:hypothetical protein